MNKIVFKLNINDDFEIDESLIIDLSTKGDYHYTFFNKIRRLYRMPHFFKDEALDLFNISLMVYFADKKVIRKNSFDSWTRKFKLFIPVISLKKWEENKELLQNLVSYLSGDIWEFEFRKRELNENEIKVFENIDKKYIKKKYIPDSFCMLSGGLDSFIGAIDLLSKNINIAFVGHYGGGKGVKPYQDKIIELLQNEYGLVSNQFFNFNATPLKGKEDTTRTRSFMFFAHAFILASSMNKKIELFIPENGLISLNIPLTNTRLGSSSTRTTHPFYMSSLQTLLDNLGLEIILKNPFQFKTKGEMIKECTNQVFLKSTYFQTMSCSHPDHVRYKKEKSPKHCGTCLPCTIRRASLKFAYSNDKTLYSDLSFSLGKAKDELRSFKIGVLDFQKRTNHNFIIQLAGKIEGKIDDYVSLYERGMEELITFLNEIHE